VIGITYEAVHAPWDKIEMFFKPDVSIILEVGSTSLLFVSGTVGIYILPIVAVGLAFFGIPRWRFAVRALSLCYFCMSVALLTRLEEPFVWQKYLSIFAQLYSGARGVLDVLPPLIMAIILSHPLIVRELGPPDVATRNV
jgi:hypothetical protein